MIVAVDVDQRKKYITFLRVGLVRSIRKYFYTRRRRSRIERYYWRSQCRYGLGVRVRWWGVFFIH